MKMATDLFGNWIDPDKGSFGGASLSSSTFSNIGGAASDLFSSRATAAGLRLKAQGDVVEGENYTLAADLAKQNENYTRTSTALKQAQAERQIYQTVGGQRSDVAGAGLSESGSAVDLLRDSASQGAITKYAISAQGAIQEQGYQEQTTAYNKLAAFAQMSADTQNKMAGDAETAGMWSAGIKGLAGIASLFTGGPAGGAGLSSTAANMGL
jgi:hypothetical protein